MTLGRGEGGFGLGDQLAAVRGQGRTGRDTSRERDPVPVHPGRLEAGRQEPSGEDLAPVGVRVGQQQRERVGARPEGPVGRASRRLDLLGEGGQDRVAAFMAVLLVHRLEVVDVD